VEVGRVEVQNVTLAIPKDLLRKVKILAAQRQTSISALLARALQELVQREETYDHARQRHLTLLEQGFDLGTAGMSGWRRDELHER
jgi:predicted transcriptional regulator